MKQFINEKETRKPLAAAARVLVQPADGIEEGPVPAGLARTLGHTCQFRGGRLG